MTDSEILNAIETLQITVMPVQGFMGKTNESYAPWIAVSHVLKREFDKRGEGKTVKEAVEKLLKQLNVV